MYFQFRYIYLSNRKQLSRNYLTVLFKDVLFSLIGNISWGSQIALSITYYHNYL